MVTFVLEKKTESTILNGKAQLPLPNLTGLLIVHVGDEGLICVARGEFGHTKIKLDLFQQVKEGLGILDGVKLEELGSDSNRRKAAAGNNAGTAAGGTAPGTTTAGTVVARAGIVAATAGTTAGTTAGATAGATAGITTGALGTTAGAGGA